MIGAIIGDIVGSVYEWDWIKTKSFELFVDRCECYSSVEKTDSI